MTDELTDEVRTGSGARVVIVLAVLAALALALWRLWPERSRGEREQAHRVLIVGGTPTDLTQPVAEAGFEADQRTWAEAEAQTRALEDRFDADALIAYADEHGYGFLALVLGEDALVGDALLGEDIPAGASVAVISVGALALDGQPRPRFGGVPEGLEFSDALRRSEGLRAALYEHPDLLRLWDDPTPEQMQQQLRLGKLDDARTLLAATLASYDEAIAAWPDPLPADAIAEPWIQRSGVPLARGLLVEDIRERLVVDARRKVRVDTSAPRSRLLPAGVDAKLPTLESGVISIDGRWLGLLDPDDGLIHRFEQREGALIEQGEGAAPRSFGDPGLLAISTAGALASADHTRVETPAGAVDFDSLEIVQLCWHDEETLALSARRELWGPPALLLLVRPAGDGPPALLGIPVSLLTSVAHRDAWISALAPSAAGTFVAVEYEGPAGARLSSLVQIVAAPGALRAPDPSDERGPVGSATVDAIEGFAVHELGIVPPFTQLSVSPDGRWLSWRAVGSRGAIYVAPIELASGKDPSSEDGSGGRSLGAPIRVGTDSPIDQRLGKGPLFSADSQSLVFTARASWAHGEIEYLRVVPIPPTLD